MIKKIKEAFNARKIRKNDKAELMAIIKDLNDKLKVQIDRALPMLEELSQDKLYYIFAETEMDAEQIREMLKIVKRGMKWTAPNILIMNCPLIELSEEKIKEIEATRKKLKRGVEL